VKLTLLLLTILICAAPAAAQDAKSAAAQDAKSWDAKNIVWQTEGKSGTKYALLEGERDTPGKAFTYAFFIPAGYWEHHWHSTDARVAVISGALSVSFGEKLDKERAKSYPAGSYLLVPANAKHSMGATVDTIIIGTAIGPWATHRHEDHKH
jgi:quercetin dioxygenase-like cupin family protein